MMLVLCDSDSFAGFSLNKAVPKKQYCTSTDQPGSWISVEEEEKEKRKQTKNYNIRAQELCESRGGRKATLSYNKNLNLFFLL